MGGGWVLDYSDATYAALFERFGIDIHGSRFQKYGTSKAKKMRAFWELENDQIVGQVLDEILDTLAVEGELNDREYDQSVWNKSKEIAARLRGVRARSEPATTIDKFLDQEFATPNLDKLPLEGAVVTIIETRIEEARRSLKGGAYLATIFLCGSVLEAVLLGAARSDPEQFNRSNACPRSEDGKPKPFQNWKLAELIDVACAVGVLKPDIQKFGHGLRDFRNYIHPYEQMLSGFTPDEHTAKVSMQVLKAALASVAGER